MRVIPTWVPVRGQGSTDLEVMKVLVLSAADMETDFTFHPELLGSGGNGGVFRGSYTGAKAAELGGPFKVGSACVGVSRVCESRARHVCESRARQRFAPIDPICL